MAHPFPPAPPNLLTSFVSLIKALYCLRDPEQVQQCSEILSDHQKGPYAFDLAFKAYQASTDQDDDVRFIAALTVSIKLKQRPTPPPNHLEFIRSHTLGWIVEAVHCSRPQYVVRRIFTTVVALFCVPSCTWRTIVDDVAVSISQGKATTSVLLSEGILSRSHFQAGAVLSFATILAEELREIAHNTEFDVVHDRAASNVRSVHLLLSHQYSGASTTRDTDVLSMLFVCHLRWLKYSKVFRTSSEDHHLLSSILPEATKVLPLISGNLEAFEAGCNLVEKSLKDSGISLTKHELGNVEMFLSSPLADAFFSQMTSGALSEAESLANFGNMALAYCRRVSLMAFLPSDPQPKEMFGHPEIKAAFLKEQRRLQDCIKTIVSHVTKSTLSNDCGESLAFGVVGFWEDFVQDTRTHQLRTEVEAFLLDAMETLCLASRSDQGQYQNEDDPDDPNDPDDNFRFNLRLRVRDLLQVAYDEYGVPVVRRLVSILQSNGNACLDAQSTSDPAWPGLEAALYFFTELSDSFHFSPETDNVKVEDEALSVIFGSPWFSQLIDPKALVPKELRKLSLATIREYSTYFGRHQVMLWPALDALLQYLQQPAFAKRAAETVSKVCDENRVVIAQAKQGSKLLEVVQQYFGVPETPSGAQMPLLAAAASVAQALADPEEAVAIDDLLTLIREHQQRRTLAIESDPQLNQHEQKTNAAATTLQHLLSTAKACQVPDDSADRPSADHRIALQQWWQTGPGAAVQQQIMHDVESALRLGAAYTTHLDTAAAIIKQGFREYLPGPFVFAPSATLAFVTGTPPTHPQFRSIATLAAEFMAANPTADDALRALLLHTTSAITHLPSTRHDPELSESLLKAATSAAKSNTNTLLTLPADALRTLLSFSLSALSAPESLPKLASTALWTSLTTSLAKPASRTLDLRTLQALLRDAGPHLVHALLENYAGGAARSDLDRLVEPLRPLVARVPETKAWLEGAVGSAEFGGGRADAARRRQFVAALLMLRGGIKTRNVVREFWGECRGVAA